jgi:hypothetical protein
MPSTITSLANKEMLLTGAYVSEEVMGSCAW